MSDDRLYEQKDKQLTRFEIVGNANLQQDRTELAYRDLNSGFFNLEKGKHQGQKLKDWEEAHKERKREIETAWHQNTATEVTELSRRASATNKKSRAYYRGYSLEELEVFVKNSDRGGNSNEYNNVATELELYNRIMRNGNKLEGLSILLRLKENAHEYIRTRRSPNSTKGKIRKAIISVISEKVDVLVEQQQNEYRSKADTLFAEAQDLNVTEEKVSEAFRAHYDLIYQVLNGTIELSKEELARLDTNTETLMNMVMEHKVDETQGNNISTKFFNALGWSSNEARLVMETDLDNNGSEMKKSPLKRRMYHAINPFGGKKDAMEEGQQLAGVRKKNNRVFFGLGRFGKGIYTSAAKDDKYENDMRAEANSWTYGDKTGAVQLVMTLNEHARMISYSEFMHDGEQKFDRMFRKLSRLLEQEKSSKLGYRDFLTMKAAFFGFNTLIDYYPNIEGVDYYVTTDRKALSISKEMRVRLSEDDENSLTTETLRKEN
ncbi:MAG: hypothetical protein K6E90_06920 [Lachnospiraceae bacterium]|nr:hypothetical protein [Lachnospiraceae bacterium]